MHTPEVLILFFTQQRFSLCAAAVAICIVAILSVVAYTFAERNGWLNGRTIVYGRGISPDGTWEVRLCKVCNFNGMGPIGWIEVLDQHGVTLKRIQFAKPNQVSIDICDDVDHVYNCVVVTNELAEISFKDYDGDLSNVLSIRKRDAFEKSEKASGVEE